MGFLQNKINIRLFVCILATGLFLSGCASTSTEEAQERAAQASSSIPDPIEPWNRGVTQLNTALDVVIFDPIAMGYNAIVPSFIRTAIGNFLTNLRTPIYAANNVLQGDVGGAGVNVARFVINTTVGVGGLIDVAATKGLYNQPEDFGQTLAVWGVGDGFYIVWPILGPSSLRDSFGMGVDAWADPVRIIAFSENEEWIYYTRSGVELVHRKAELVDVLRDTRRDSLDYYSTLKSMYEQRRAALIRDLSYDPKSRRSSDEYSDDNYEVIDYDSYYYEYD